jgi:hypothetical protein
MNRKEKKQLKKSIEDCLNTVEDHDFCKVISYGEKCKGIDCRYIGVEKQIPVMKDGYQGYRMAYGCNKFNPFSRRVKRAQCYAGGVF